MPERDPLDRDPTVRVLAPHAAPAEGRSVVRTDLAGFFVVVEEVGRDEALLLLLVRALRQRYGFDRVALHDLVWMLRASHGRVRTWLDRLTRHGRVEYVVEDRHGNEIVFVEILREREASPFATHHDLPTAWFVQTLPLLGRATFAVFLFVLSRDAHDGLLRPDDVARAVRLPHRHALRHLRRLRERGMLMKHPETHLLTLVDPRPLGARDRVRLRLLALPYFRGVAREITYGLVALLALVALLLFLPRA